jgi:hypothetical protein
MSWLIFLRYCFQDCPEAGLYQVSNHISTIMADNSFLLDEERNVPGLGKVNTDYYIRGLCIPKYRTAMAQVVMIGLIAFCTV